MLIARPCILNEKAMVANRAMGWWDGYIVTLSAGVVAYSRRSLVALFVFCFLRMLDFKSFLINFNHVSFEPFTLQIILTLHFAPFM